MISQLMLPKPTEFTVPLDLKPTETRWAWYAYQKSEPERIGNRLIRPVIQIGWVRGRLD